MKILNICTKLLLYIIFYSQINVVELVPGKKKDGTVSSRSSSSALQNGTPGNSTENSQSGVNSQNGTNTRVTLSLETGHDTNEVNCGTKGKMLDFTPKANYVFDAVKSGNDEIWKATANESSKRVLLVGNGNGEKKLFVYLDDDVKKFHKPSASENWTEKQPPADLTPVDLDLKNRSADFSYEYSEAFERGSFLPFKNFLFKSVKFGNDSLWSTNNQSEYANKVLVRDPKNDSLLKKVSVFLVNEDVKHFEKDNNQWKEKPNDVELDVENKQVDLDEWDYSEKNNFRTYTRNENYLFKSVKYGNEAVWTSSDGVFAKKVVVNEKDSTDLYLYLLLVNDNFLVFNKKQSGTWKDVTSERFKLSELKLFADGGNLLNKDNYNVQFYNSAYCYNFKDGVNCQKVMYGNQELWKFTDKYPTGLCFQMKKNEFHLVFGHSTSQKLDVSATNNQAQTN